STSSNYSTVAASSVTASLSLSTLTVQGLAGGNTYYLRVSGLNTTGTYNWTTIGSTVTSIGGQPTNPLVGTVSSSTIQTSWTSPGGVMGFVVQASLAEDFSGPLITTVTSVT